MKKKYERNFEQSERTPHSAVVKEVDPCDHMDLNFLICFLIFLK